MHGHRGTRSQTRPSSMTQCRRFTLWWCLVSDFWNRIPFQTPRLCTPHFVHPPRTLHAQHRHGTFALACFEAPTFLIVIVVCSSHRRFMRVWDIYKLLTRHGLTCPHTHTLSFSSHSFGHSCASASFRSSLASSEPRRLILELSFRPSSSVTFDRPLLFTLTLLTTSQWRSATRSSSASWPPRPSWASPTRPSAGTATQRQSPSLPRPRRLP